MDAAEKNSSKMVAATMADFLMQFPSSTHTRQTPNGLPREM